MNKIKLLISDIDGTLREMIDKIFEMDGFYD